jgi:drug/metabolite transporter (DMT)-like permease
VAYSAPIRSARGQAASVAPGPAATIRHSGLHRGPAGDLRILSPTQTRPLFGIVLMLLAGACFTVLDATAKYLVATVPVLMVLWVRYVMQAVLSSALMAAAGQHTIVRTRHPWLQAFRGLLLLASSLMAVFSLKYMPLAEFTAVVMITPVVVSLFSVFVFGERLGPVGWGLLVASFAGTLLIVKPAGSFYGWAALFPFACTVLAAMYQLVSARLGRTDPPTTTHLLSVWIAAGVATLGAPVAWSPVSDPAVWAWMCLMGLMGALGHLLLAHAYRHASALMLAPFHYATLIWAVLVGWLVFDHTSDPWAWAGIGLIVSCGLLKTRLQAQALRRAMSPAAPAPPSVSLPPATPAAQTPAVAARPGGAAVTTPIATTQGGRR